MRIFTKRLLAVLLSVIMVIMVVPVSSITVSAENTTEFLGGEGTEEKPYLISNKTHLNNVRYHLYAHFKMVADIVFTEADFAEGGEFYNNGQGWEPIGTFQSPFFGTFDGNQHSITGLYCNQRGSSYMYVGFFGYNTGHIQNFGMVDAYVYAQTTSPSDSVCVGGISGYNNGMIVNCYNTGSIFSNSFNDYAYAGGIAGYNNKTVINCYNTGVISSTSAFTYGGGGITGINYGMISSCYNTGNVTGEVISVCTGGIAGKNLGTGTINNCYNIGKISAMSSTDATNGLCNAGGITGVNASKSIVNNCYNVGDAFASATGTKYARPYAGGISGDNDGIIQNCYYWGTNDHGVGSGIDVAVKCTFEQMKQSSTFLEYNFDTIWKFTNEDIYPFPVLQGVPHIKGINIDPYIGFFDGIGTKEDPYLISTKAHLNNVRNHLDAHFKMVADIVFTEADFAEGGEFYNDGQGWEPIGGNGSTTFTGVFDGDEHTITGLYCNRSGDGVQCAGLFGYNKGIIHNLGIEDGDISSKTLSSDTSSYAGGIAGYNDNNGTINDCYNTGSTSASSDYYAYAGGIAGYNDNDGTISNCYNIGSVSASSNAGGILGNNSGTISNCYNVGDVSKSYDAGGIAGSNSGTISNCYNIGDVSKSYYVGGIAGRNYKTITNCYYLDNILKGVGNGTDTTIKCTVEQMKQQSTFIGFDFDTVWEIDGYYSYPYPQLKNNQQQPIQPVQSIELLSQSADIQVIEGLWPDSIDATVKITYADGLKITTNVTSQMLSELDISQIGTQTIHLIYGGKVTAETIDVEVIPKSISSIAVTTLPDKTTYVQGQPLNPAGGELTVSYNNNTSEIVDLSEAQLSYPLEQTGIVTATAEYKGFSATFSVTINEKQIQSIGIIEPEKLSYIEGETLDLTGGKLQITYVSEDNYTERIPLAVDMISGYDPNVIGLQTLTVGYEGQKITFVVRVTAKSLTHIAVTARPDKISYLEDKDAFDPTGGKVTLYYNNDTNEAVDLTAEMVTGFDNTQVGKQALTVTYEGFTDTFEVEITAKKLSAIKLTTLPTKLAYTKNYEAFDPAGGKVTLYYNNDTSEVIDLSVEMVSGFDNTQVGKQTLIVIYEGFNDTFEIEILAYLPGDTDGDSKVTIDDVAYLLNHVYFPELYPVSQECDFNGDDTVNIDDVAYLLNHVYFPDIYPLE